jgi:hypothetical protein
VDAEIAVIVCISSLTGLDWKVGEVLSCNYGDTHTREASAIAIELPIRISFTSLIAPIPGIEEAAYGGHRQCYWGAGPSKQSAQRLKTKVREILSTSGKSWVCHAVRRHFCALSEIRWRA